MLKTPKHKQHVKKPSNAGNANNFAAEKPLAKNEIVKKKKKHAKCQIM